jgi:hypothetical protein
VAVINNNIKALRLAKYELERSFKVNQFPAFIFGSKMLAKIDFS